MDANLKKVLNDRFEAFELCEFLQVSTEDFLERFEDVIEDNLEEIEELAGIGEDDEDV